MAFKPLVYVGINISGSHRSYTLAAIDVDLHLQALSQGEEMEVLGFCAGSTSVLVSSIYLSGVNDLAIDGNRLTWAEAYVPGTYSRDRMMSAMIVPEPSTLALLGMVVFSLLAYVWRRRK